MIRKEFKEVGIQSLILLTSALIMPLPVMLIFLSKTPAPYGGVFFVLFQTGLIFFSLFLGISLFSSERRNQGMEYLLSLPYSRFRLMTYKLMPRFTALISFYLLYLIFYFTFGEPYSLMTFTSFSYIYLVLFIASLYFSITHDNFIASFVTAFFTASILIGVLFFLYRIGLAIRGGDPSWIKIKDVFMIEKMNYREPRLMIWAILCLVLPFAISFIAAFKNLDLKPAKKFNKHYFKIFIPLLILGLVGSFVFVYSDLDSGWRSYYLTENQQLIEFNEFTTKIYDKENVRKLPNSYKFYFWRAIEYGDYLYDMNYFKSDQALFRFNQKTLESEIIYRPKVKQKLGYRLYTYQKKLVFFLFDSKNKWTALMEYDIQTGQTKKIMANQVSHLGTQIFGTDVINGQRFWLARISQRNGHLPLLFWENGQSQTLALSTMEPLYVNHMIISVQKKNLVFQKIRQHGLETVKTLDTDQIYIPMSWRLDLNNMHMNELYGTKSAQFKAKRIFRLDMNTLTIQEISSNSGYIKYTDSGSFYLISRNKVDDKGNYWMKAISQLKDGKITLMKEFENVSHHKRSYIYKTGILVEHKDKVRVYAFPDMEEIKFKKLR